MNPDNSRKKMLVIIGVTSVVIIVGIFLLLFGRTKTYEYIVLVDPPDSILTIDGTPTKPGTISLTKGEHTLKATRDLFEDAVVVVNTDNFTPGQEIFVLPTAVSPEAIAYLESLPDPQNISEKIGAAITSQRATAVNEKYPVVEKLPYNSIDFGISYSVDDDLNISFAIALYPYAKPDNPAGRKKQLTQFKNDALTFLRSNGIDTNTAKITYDPAEAADL